MRKKSLLILNLSLTIILGSSAVFSKVGATSLDKLLKGSDFILKGKITGI